MLARKLVIDTTTGNGDKGDDELLPAQKMCPSNTTLPIFKIITHFIEDVVASKHSLQELFSRDKPMMPT